MDNIDHSRLNNSKRKVENLYREDEYGNHNPKVFKYQKCDVKPNYKRPMSKKSLIRSFEMISKCDISKIPNDILPCRISFKNQGLIV